MTVEIPLRLGMRIIGYALVDAEDAPGLMRKRWCLTGGYAVETRRVPGCSGAMHRQLLDLAPGDRVVHHINEDKLDNRRANLLVCADAREANTQPHPERDAAAREGVQHYLARTRSA